MLASTVTTVAVFLPVIFIEEEAGQLFKDIAIAISFAIIISLIVSVSAIPSITHQFYRWRNRKKKANKDRVGRAGASVAGVLVSLSALSIRNWKNTPSDRGHADDDRHCRGFPVEAQGGISSPGQPQPGSQYHDSTARVLS